jgi:hypothetical protein
MLAGPLYMACRSLIALFRDQRTDPGDETLAFQGILDIIRSRIIVPRHCLTDVLRGRLTLPWTRKAGESGKEASRIRYRQSAG